MKIIIHYNAATMSREKTISSRSYRITLCVCVSCLSCFSARVEASHCTEKRAAEVYFHINGNCWHMISVWELAQPAAAVLGAFYALPHAFFHSAEANNNNNNSKEFAYRRFISWSNDSGYDSRLITLRVRVYRLVVVGCSCKTGLLTRTA